MGFLSAIGSIVGNIIAPGVGGAIGGGLGSLGDNLIGGSASQSAASTQAGGANAATALQAQMYNQNRTDHLPYLGAGVAANNQLAYLMGITPTDPNAGPNETAAQTAAFNPTAGVNTALGASGSLAQPFSTAQFQQDPGYQFALDQGEKALQNSAAAKGGLFSGATGKAINTFAQGTANQQYQAAYDRYNTNQNNLYSRLGGLSNSGQGAANTVGAAGQNYATQAGNTIQTAANQTASGQVAQANAWSTGLNGLGTALGQPVGQQIASSPFGANYNTSSSIMTGLDPSTGITWG